MRIIASILALATLAVGVWWWRHPAPPVKKSVRIYPASQVAAPEAVAPDEVPETPSFEPVPLPPPPPPAADPQIDVHTAVDDMVGLLRAGDFLGFVARYMPPEVRDHMAANPAAVERMAQDMLQANVPGTREYQELQGMIQMLENARGGTEPALNEAGDEATYQGTDRNPIRLIKVDGKWYAK